MPRSISVTLLIASLEGNGSPCRVVVDSKEVVDRIINVVAKQSRLRCEFYGV